MKNSVTLPLFLLFLVLAAPVAMAHPAPPSPPAEPAKPNTNANELTTLPLVPTTVANPLNAAYWPLHFGAGTSANHPLSLPAPVLAPAGDRHLQIWLRADCLARPRLALGTDATHARLIPFATPLACSDTEKVEVVEFRVPLAKDQHWSHVAVGVDPQGELVGKPITAWIRAVVVNGPSPDPALQLTGPTSPTSRLASTTCSQAGLRLAVLSVLRPVNLARAHQGVLHATGSHGRVWVGGWDDPGTGLTPVQVLRAGGGQDLGKDGLDGMAVLDYPERDIGKDGLYALCQTF